MDTEFKTGDLVELKSGGPQMTVGFYLKPHSKWVCYWFIGSEKKESDFPKEVLKHVTKKSM
jgi:uncharacterized protein YodC (DUF2158 family)